jgi:hypothetical protein
VKNTSSFPPLAPLYHFSVDDVFQCLIEVSDQHIPIFCHPFFKFLLEIHTEFNVNIGLHLFFQERINGKIRKLSEVADIKQELAAAGPWLFFGPHALSPDISPYMQSQEDQETTFANIYNEIDRFAGPASYAKSIRLHHYSESYELSSFFRKRGVQTLFSTDRDITSHRMPDDIKHQLKKLSYATHKYMQFVRTHFRVEFLTEDRCDAQQLHSIFKEVISRYGFTVFYTHEYELKRPEVRRMTRMCMETLKSLSLPSIIQP